MKKRIISLILAVFTAMSVLLAGSVTAAEESPYTDVKPKRWSYADIMYVTEKGLMNGTEPGKFAPAETMTRAMVVTVLYRLQGEPKTAFTTKFSDVKEGKWYTDAILWAAENDIVNGVGNGKFDPMGTITREQLAAIIQRYAPMEYIITEERADITKYADYKRVHDYAREAMAWANAIGLITGKTDTTLAPREGATREQFSKILRCFKEYDSYNYELVYNPPVYSTELNKTTSLVKDADIYVATDGNDSNDGSFENPIKTFSRAKELVRELKKTATDGIIVAFKAGEYGSLDNLTFTVDDAGTSDVPITYCAYGDGDVIFSNGIIISPEDFKPISENEQSMFSQKVIDKIYKVDLNGMIDELTTKNVLFGNSGLLYEARYPNKNADGSDAHYTNCTTRVEEEGKAEHEYDKLLLQAVAKVIADRFSTYDGLKITGMFRTGWLIDTFNVKSYDRDTGIMTLDFGDGNFENGYPLTGHGFPLAYEGRMNDTIFFHNLAELLDTTGEYWFDINTKNLYIYDPQGEYALSNSGTFITLEEGANNISFVGLEFNTSTDSAVNIKSDYITIDGCTFANIAGLIAVNANNEINHFTFKNCELYNFICGGVVVRADADVKQLIPAYNIVTNNYFHDFGLPQYFEHSTAVEISRDVNAEVSHNVFKNGAHAAIVYNDSIETFIEYNIFDNMMTTTKDYGAVYCWNNVGERSNTIRYNLFMNLPAKGGAHGVYIDGYSCGQIVYNNIFYNCGDRAVTLNGGRDNEVYNNIIITTDDFNGTFLLYAGGVYGALLGGSEKDSLNDFYSYMMRRAPREGEEGYKKWYKRWPIIYNYNSDPEKIGEYECVFTIINYIKNNALIGCSIQDTAGLETFEKFGVNENNTEFSTDVNPYFVDPTHGDYRIKDDAPIFKIPVEEIGRY